MNRREFIGGLAGVLSGLWGIARVEATTPRCPKPSTAFAVGQFVAIKHDANILKYVPFAGDRRTLLKITAKTRDGGCITDIYPDNPIPESVLRLTNAAYQALRIDPDSSASQGAALSIRMAKMDLLIWLRERVGPYDHNRVWFSEEQGRDVDNSGRVVHIMYVFPGRKVPRLRGRVTKYTDDPDFEPFRISAWLRDI